MPFDHVTIHAPHHRALGAAAAGLALLLVWFGSLGTRALLHPDEGRYAEIPREMLSTGDWVTPRLDGLKYFEKPPLQYWSTALGFALFGRQEFAARLWPGLTGFLGVVATLLIGTRLWDARAGCYGAAMLASTPGWFVNAHMLTLDTGVAFFLAVAVGVFALAQQDRCEPRQRRRAMLVVWFAMACAVLSKGLIGIVLPTLTLVGYACLQRDWRLWRRIELARGLLVFGAVTVPWFVLVSLRNPEFAPFFFIHEHFDRFTSTVHNRWKPWWFFIPVLVIGFLPWTGLLATAARAAWHDRAPGFSARRLFLVWSVLVFGFFSASGSKLSGYVLPIWPPLALLCGRALRDATPRAACMHLAVVPAIGFGAAIAAPWAFAHAGDHGALNPYRAMLPWVLASAALLFVGGAAGVGLAWRRHRDAAVITASAASMLCALLVMQGHDACCAPGLSARDFARICRERLREDTVVYSVGTYQQTLPYYLGRRLVLVDYVNEFELGIRAEPGKAIDFATFAQRWRSAATPSLAALEPRALGLLDGSGLAYRIVAQSPHLVMVERVP